MPARTTLLRDRESLLYRVHPTRLGAGRRGECLHDFTRGGVLQERGDGHARRVPVGRGLEREVMRAAAGARRGDDHVAGHEIVGQVLAAVLAGADAARKAAS